MSNTGDSVVTEPIIYDEEDVFVASLEDPAKKYADLTKKAIVAKATPPIIPEEEGPPSFIGSKLCYFAVCWAVLVIVVIVVAVVSATGGGDDKPSDTIAPTIPEPVEMSPAPSVPPLPETTTPTAVPVTDAPDIPVDINVTVAPTEDELGDTDAPEETEAPVTEAPTLSPTVETGPPTTVATMAPTIATASPTGATAAPTIATASPTVSTDAPTTLAPTTESPTGAIFTEATTLAPSTDAPTPAGVTGSPTLMPTKTTLASILPTVSQVALEDPTSPQSFAYLFVYYDPNVDTRTDEELVQRFALASLYFSLGRMWTNGQVLPAQSECLWFAETGTYCNDQNQVEGLLLSGNNLEGGPIPPEIGLLTSLKQVDMSDNFITGTIPTYFGQLQLLETLNLAQNQQITGTIPTELSSIATLQTLDLTGLDFLTGVVPSGVCGVTLSFSCQPASLCGCDCQCEAGGVLRP